MILLLCFMIYLGGIQCSFLLLFFLLLRKVYLDIYSCNCAWCTNIGSIVNYCNVVIYLNIIDFILVYVETLMTFWYSVCFFLFPYCLENDHKCSCRSSWAWAFFFPNSNLCMWNGYWGNTLLIESLIYWIVIIASMLGYRVSLWF